MKFKRIPYADIGQLYFIKIQDYSNKIYFDNIPDADYIWGDDPNMFSVFEGDTHLPQLDVTIINDHYFDENKDKHRAVFITGNLIVDGNINLYETSDVGMPRYLFVTGNVKAKSISIGGYVEMIVLGNVQANEIIASGKILAKGDLNAEKLYVARPVMTVFGETKIGSFYVATYKEGELIEDFNPNEGNYSINIANSQPIVQCPEPGVKYFENLPLLYSEDFEDFTEERQESITQESYANRVFSDIFYNENDDLDIERAIESLNKGEKVFKY